MGKISDLPKLDRPREKAIRYGLDKLSDSELLALILGFGYQGESAKDVADNLISKYNGLLNLSKVPIKDLVKVKGIGESKAVELAAIFEIHKRINIKEYENYDDEVDSDYLAKKYWPQFKDETQEMLVMVIVSKRNTIIYECQLYKGTDDEMAFAYQNIWRELLIHKGAAFYLLHNHPNQDLTPSLQDKIITDELFHQSELRKTPMKDHLIIGANKYYSFKKMKISNISC